MEIYLLWKSNTAMSRSQGEQMITLLTICCGLFGFFCKLMLGIHFFYTLIFIPKQKNLKKMLS